MSSFWEEKKRNHINLKTFANSQTSAWNSNFFLTVGHNNFGNKIPYLVCLPATKSQYRNYTLYIVWLPICLSLSQDSNPSPEFYICLFWILVTYIKIKTYLVCWKLRIEWIETMLPRLLSVIKFQNSIFESEKSWCQKTSCQPKILINFRLQCCFKTVLKRLAH